MRTGRDVLDWMKPVERQLDVYESLECQRGGLLAEVKRNHNRTRKRANSNRRHRRAERFYADAVVLAKLGLLSELSWLTLYAEHFNRSIGEELFADVPEELLQ